MRGNESIFFDGFIQPRLASLLLTCLILSNLPKVGPRGDAMNDIFDPMAFLYSFAAFNFNMVINVAF